MDQTILVTGGAGYIGSHVCKALSRHGFLPITIDNLSSGNETAVKWGPFEYSDINDSETVSSVIDRYAPDAVIHLAGSLDISESKTAPAQYYKNNVTGTLCLIDTMKKHDIDDIVLSSSAAVYGAPQSMQPLTESSALDPVNVYGRTKLMMEHAIRDYTNAYGMRVGALRYFNAAGADIDNEAGTAYKNDTHLIPLLMQAAAGQTDHIKLFGNDYNTRDGSAIRDYVHVTDIAEAHIKALQYMKNAKKSLTANLGSGCGYSVSEVINAARRITGHAIPAIEYPRRDGDPPMLVANARHAKETLGWIPQYSDLDTIITTAWAWKQKQTGTPALKSRKVA